MNSLFPLNDIDTRIVVLGCLPSDAAVNELMLNYSIACNDSNNSIRGMREVKQKISMPAQVTSHDGMHKTTRFASNIWSESCQTQALLPNRFHCALLRCKEDYGIYCKYLIIVRGFGEVVIELWKDLLSMSDGHKIRASTPKLSHANVINHQRQ